MITITANVVRDLRKKTGAGMMDCKNALAEAGGDVEAAIVILRRKGVASGDERQEKTTKEGTIEIVLEGNVARMAEGRCETDFVARNAQFRAAVLCEMNNKGQFAEDTAKFGEKTEVTRFVKLVAFSDRSRFYSYRHSTGKIGVLVEIEESLNPGYTDNEEFGGEVAMHIAATNPQYVFRDEVPQEIVDKEREFLLGQPDLLSKPEAVREKMVEGRLNKFFAERCLLDQPFVKDPKKTVGLELKKRGSLVKGFVRYDVGSSEA